MLPICRVKCLEFLYFWLYPETERQAASAASKRPESQSLPSEPMTPSTPRHDRTTPRATAASSTPSEAPRTPTDGRLRAMLESAHDTWTPTTPSKPSRTFEKTQLALSRSAAAAAMSPRKRPLHVSTGLQATDFDDGSPRAKRSSLSYSASPASIAQPRPIRRVLPASPSGRPRSVLAASSARTSSSANHTPPVTPREEPRNAKLPPHARFAEAAEENHFKSPPKLLWSPSKSAYPSASPALDRQTSKESPALERRRSRDVSGLERLRTSDSPALSRTSSSNDAKEAMRRRLSRSLHASAVSGQPYRNLTELPGVSGQTKGLFAPKSPAPLQEEQTPEGRDLQPEEEMGSGKADTYERRRQILGQHIGNLDQLLHRFEVLRCR